MAPTARAPSDHLVSGAAAEATTVPAAAVAVAAEAAAAACCEDGAGLEKAWRAVQGCNDWEGLVEPLHPLLRAELVRYGELVAACYKSFDVDPASKRYLKSKYSKESMMREVGMGDSGYTVTRYLYMTPAFGGALSRRWAFHGRWIGYVAVASDRQARRLGRRDVVVTFRGTATAAEWAANLMSSLTPARLDPGDPRPDVKVEWGFLSMYTSDDGAGAFGHGGCREQLISELSRILGKYDGEELSVTFAGHSMGGAMAILAGYDIAELGLNRNRRGREVPVTVYSFGGPRVGNAGFKARCEELGVKVLRVVNVKDPITKMPGVFLNENLIRVLGRRHALLPWSCCSSCYAHVGVEVALDFLEVKDLAGVHDLGTYLRLLRSPSALQAGKEEDDDDLLGKISRSWSRYRSFHALPWLNAAASVGNLVQSLGLV